MIDYHSVDLNSILNAILVQENVRNASLIQPADYNEATGHDTNMKSIQKKLKTYFPDLIFSDQYQTYQGVIVSKQSYNGQEISLQRMGEILGYPCVQDFNNYNNKEEVSYLIEINVVFEDGTVEQLIANGCKNIDKKSAFDAIAKKMEHALKKPQYNKMLEGREIKQVDVFVEKTIPTKVLVEKLSTNQPLDREDKDKVINIIYNFGFSMEMQFFFRANFEYDNPVHKGFLLGLILLERNYILSPFIPLQNYPEQDKKLQGILEKWEEEIMQLLKRTKMKKRSAARSKATKSKASNSKTTNSKTLKKYNSI